jgi:hypothetical protein
MKENEITSAILKAIEECTNEGLGIGDDWVRDNDVRRKIPSFSDTAGKADFRRWIQSLESDRLVERQTNGDDWVVKMSGKGVGWLLATDSENAASDEAEKAVTPRKIVARPDLLERIRSDDPNHDVVKPPLLEARADLHGLVADTFGSANMRLGRSTDRSEVGGHPPWENPTNARKLNEILAKFGTILAIASPEERPSACAGLVQEITQLYVEPGFTSLCNAGSAYDFLGRLDTPRISIRLACEGLVGDNDLLSRLVDAEISNWRAKGWGEIEAKTAPTPLAPGAAKPISRAPKELKMASVDDPGGLTPRRIGVANERRDPLDLLVTAGGWPASLPAECLTTIRAVLSDAAVSSWTSPGLAGTPGFEPRTSPDAMRWAFDRIAAVLFERGILTEDRLPDIALLVWESARAGDWWKLDEKDSQAFRDQRSHPDAWSDQEALFRAEMRRWKGRLESPHAAVCPGNVVPQRFAQRAMDRQRYDREIQIAGPNDVQIVIHPAPNHFSVALISRTASSLVQPVTDCYLWKIHNGALQSLRGIHLELASIQSFDERKSAFRERINLGFRWPAFGDIGAGAWTNDAILLRVDGDHVRLWNNDATPELPWPNGDQSPIRCWRLTIPVIGLSIEWAIELDLRWTVDARRLEIAKSGDGILATDSTAPSPTTDGSQRCPVAVALEPSQSAPSIPASINQLDNTGDNAIPQSQDDGEFDFTTADGRIEAIVRYTKGWSTDLRRCSEASLARTAIVDRGDLSKWKKGLLPAGSDKARRIEDALKGNKPPTPAASRTTQG